jgi:hypothetical protein
VNQSKELVCAGTFTDPKEINSILLWASENCHLISPVTQVGALPLGFAMALAEFRVDISTTRDDKGREIYAKDTYKAGLSENERGLSKNVLMKIAAAYGIEWDPRASGRIDDRSNPYYVNWLAVGHVQGMDGKTVTYTDNKEVDLRDGSPQVQALQAQQARYNKNADGQVREQRLHAQSMAETKAKLRLIRSACALKTSYTLAELQKKFVVARLMYTGRTGDKELDRALAVNAADKFLGGSMRALYGVTEQQRPGAPMRSLTAPPAVGVIPADFDGDDEEPEPAPARQQPQRERPGLAAANPAQQPAQSQGGGERSGLFMPFGDNQGDAIEDCDDAALNKMAAYLSKQIEGGKSRFPDKDKKLLAGIQQELEWRAQERAGQSEPTGSDY